MYTYFAFKVIYANNKCFQKSNIQWDIFKFFLPFGQIQMIKYVTWGH